MVRSGRSTSEVFENIPNTVDEDSGNSLLRDIVDSETDALLYLMNDEGEKNYLVTSMSEDLPNDIYLGLRDILEIDRSMTTSPLMYADVHCHLFTRKSRYICHMYTWIERLEDRSMMCLTSICYCPITLQMSWTIIDEVIKHVRLYEKKSDVECATMRIPDLSITTQIWDRYSRLE